MIKLRYGNGLEADVRSCTRVEARVSCPKRKMVASVMPTADCEPAKKSFANTRVDVSGISARKAMVKLSQCNLLAAKLAERDETTRLTGKAKTTRGKNMKAAPSPRPSPPGPRKTVVAPRLRAIMRSARVLAKTKLAMRAMAFPS